MVQAVGSSSTVAPEPPPEDIINATLDPLGSMVHFRLEALFAPDQIAEFRTIFIARHMIATEIERLMGLLDALDGDPDVELNLSGHHWNDDPRLDDAEQEDADLDEADDEETDHSGCGDWDGLTEQGV